MNKLLGDRILLEFNEDTEKKDAYEERDSGIFIPNQPERQAEIKEAKVILISKDLDCKDIKEGMTVYAKKRQGELVSPDSSYYLFREDFIIGYD